MSPKYLTSLFQWESVFIHLVSNCLLFLVSKVLSTISSSVKGLIFLCSVFLMVQLSQPCVVTGKTLALVVVWCPCIFLEFWAQENRAYYHFLLFPLFAFGGTSNQYILGCFILSNSMAFAHLSFLLKEISSFFLTSIYPNCFFRLPTISGDISYI